MVQAMPMFSRFQWIPMIVKAYNEAKLRTAPRPGGDGTPSPAPVPPKSPKKRAVLARPTSAHSRSKQRATASTRRQRPLPSHRPNARSSRNPDGQKVILPEREYQSMLRELRETRAKLAKLESVNHRLSQLQIQLEQRLNDLLLKVQPNADTHSGELHQAAVQGNSSPFQPTNLPPRA
jgi:hypothetical protein